MGKTRLPSQFGYAENWSGRQAIARVSRTRLLSLNEYALIHSTVTDCTKPVRLMGQTGPIRVCAFSDSKSFETSRHLDELSATVPCAGGHKAAQPRERFGRITSNWLRTGQLPGGS